MYSFYDFMAMGGTPKKTKKKNHLPVHHAGMNHPAYGYMMGVPNHPMMMAPHPEMGGMEEQGESPAQEAQEQATGQEMAVGGYYIGNDGMRHKSKGSTWSGNTFYQVGGPYMLPDYPFSNNSNQDKTGLVFWNGSSNPGANTTPTGKSNRFVDNMHGFDPQSFIEKARKFGLDTSSNLALQRSLMQKYPDAVNKMMQVYGNTNAGRFDDGILGARTVNIFDYLPNNTPSTEQPQQPAAPKPTPQPAPYVNPNTGYVINVRGDSKDGAYYFPKNKDMFDQFTNNVGTYTNREYEGTHGQATYDMNDNVFKQYHMKDYGDLIGPAYMRDPKNPNQFIPKHQKGGMALPLYNMPSAYMYDVLHPNFYPTSSDSAAYKMMFNKAMQQPGISPEPYYNEAVNLRTGDHNQYDAVHGIDAGREAYLRAMMLGNAIEDAKAHTPKKAEGGIHIKKSHQGRFTEWAHRHGYSMSEAIQAGKHSKSASVRKMATFAANARHWKHQDGGPIVGDEMDVTPDQLEQLRQQGYQFEIM